jgi:SAM-dependent methyltransferase
MTVPHCRACGAELTHPFCDLGLSPISNAFIRPDQLNRGETFYPLDARVCQHCWLVQLTTSPDSNVHFNAEYVYFSSFSESWLAHCRAYVDAMTRRFGLGASSQVVEVASNDGYLLQYFVAAGIPCLGVEPTANTAAAARQRSVPTRELFFGKATAAALKAEGFAADLLLGNNVLAHVPDINDFVAGLVTLLKPQGVVTLEFPHLLRLIAGRQFDTIYHEHYSYLSLIALAPIFARQGLRLFDVEELPTHGGSLRLYACRADALHQDSGTVDAMLAAERGAGLDALATYADFSRQVLDIKLDLLRFVLDARRTKRRIAAYGAAAKGNTLLNYCGIGRDFVDFVVDRNPVKQGSYLPGTRIPVLSPDALAEKRPDYLLILPWNLRDEVIAQNTHTRAWGGRFVLPIPQLEIVP